MVEMNVCRPLGCAFVVALALLCGCADQQKVREQDLGELIAWLPGRYDNSAQVAEESKQSGHPALQAIALLIMPVSASRLGHHVFFVQESAANDPRRIMGSSMFSFDTDEKNGIVGLVYEFNEPVRWHDGLQHPELFNGLMTEDVSSAGCEFIWKKQGDAFIASHDPKRCHSTVPQAGQNAAELTPNTFSVGAYHYKRTGTH